MRVIVHVYVLGERIGQKVRWCGLREIYQTGGGFKLLFHQGRSGIALAQRQL